MKKYFLALFGLLFFIPNFTNAMELTSSTLYTDPNLVHYYRFENNVNDSKGTYNGTAFNLTYNATGKFGYSGIFNGTSSYVTTTNFTGETEWTMNLWFKTTTTTKEQYLFITPNGMMGLYGGNDFLGEIWTSNNGQTPAVRADGVITIDLNWHMLTMTRDATNYAEYYDGNLVTTTFVADTPSDFNNATRIGNRYKTNGTPAEKGFYAGEIDDVSFFNRDLSSLEVAALYASYVTPTTTTSTATTTSTLSANDSNTLYMIGVGILIITLLAILDFIRRNFNFFSKEK